MRKSNVYTRRGDSGTTGLIGGKRVPKNDVRVEAYGTVDELNACIGLLLTKVDREDDRTFLEGIQYNLFVLGSYLATEIPEGKEQPSGAALTENDVACMEQEIDRIDDLLPVWRGFVLPGGSESSALCHVCRTVCRRAERRILDLAEQKEVASVVCSYVNRLSDYLFVLSRKLLFDEGKDEIIWRKRP